MTVLDLENMTVTETAEDTKNVFVVEVNVTEARAILNEMGEDHENLISALDNAQGEVFNDNEPVAYLVIKITK
jgi:hypothetical protein